MLKEELLKMLKNVPDGADINIQAPIEPSVEPSVEPHVDSPIESPIKSDNLENIPNDKTITITAADFMRMVEEYSQKQKNNNENKEVDNHAEVFLY